MTNEPKIRPAMTECAKPAPDYAHELTRIWGVGYGDVLRFYIARQETSIADRIASLLPPREP